MDSGVRPLSIQPQLELKIPLSMGYAVLFIYHVHQRMRQYVALTFADELIKKYLIQVFIQL